MLIDLVHYVIVSSRFIADSIFVAFSVINPSAEGETERPQILFFISSKDVLVSVNSASHHEICSTYLLTLLLLIGFDQNCLLLTLFKVIGDCIGDKSHIIVLYYFCK